MARLRYNLQSGLLGAAIPAASPGASQTLNNLFASPPSFATLVPPDTVTVTLDNIEVVDLTAYTAGSVNATVTRGAESTPAPAHAPSTTGGWAHNPTVLDFLSVGSMVVVPPSGDTTGVTDSANIQAAINRLQPAGGTVQLLAGTYYIHSTILVPAQTGNPQQGLPIILRGAAPIQDGQYQTIPYGTICIAKSLAGDMFATVNTTAENSLCMEQMSLYGTKVAIGASQSVGSLIHTYNNTDQWFRELELNSAFNSGLFIDSANNFGYQGTYSPNITHVRAERCGQPATLDAGIRLVIASSGVILSSHIQNCNYGIYSEASTNNMAIAFCSAESCTAHGISISGSRNTVAFCTARNNSNAGIYMSSAAQFGSHGGSCFSNIAESNNVSNGGFAGIQFDQIDRASCVGNVSFDSNGTQAYGFWESGASSDFNNIGPNNFSGNVTGAVKAVVGPNTVLRGNAGYNPVGVLPPPTFTASPTVIAKANFDRTFYIQANVASTTCQIQGGPLVTVPIAQLFPVICAAGLTLTVSWGVGVAPSAVVEGQ